VISPSRSHHLIEGDRDGDVLVGIDADSDLPRRRPAKGIDLGGFKYRPDFPARFGCIEDARAFCGGSFGWYNGAHRHSGISLFTPADVHYGRSGKLLEVRADVLAGAYVRIPLNSPGHSAVNSPPCSRVLAHPSEAAPAADAKRQFIP
jgi:hypothetical protein